MLNIVQYRVWFHAFVHYAGRSNKYFAFGESSSACVFAGLRRLSGANLRIRERIKDPSKWIIRHIVAQDSVTAYLTKALTALYSDVVAGCTFPYPGVKMKAKSQITMLSFYLNQR